MTSFRTEEGILFQVARFR